MESSTIKIEEVLRSTPLLVEQVYDLIVQLDPKVTKENFGEWVGKVLEFPSCNLFVARNQNGQYLGLLILVSYPMIEGFTKTWIESLIVDEKIRGKGVGRLLIKYALDFAKNQGAKFVNLTSRPELIAANNLYKNLGFKLRETNYYRFSFD